jgi:hypothetical protein
MSDQQDPLQRLSRQLGEFAKSRWRRSQSRLQAAVPILGLLIGASAGLGMRQAEAWLVPFLAAPHAISQAATVLGAAKAQP